MTCKDKCHSMQTFILKKWIIYLHVYEECDVYDMKKQYHSFQLRLSGRMDIKILNRAASSRHLITHLHHLCGLWGFSKNICLAFKMIWLAVVYVI